MCSICKSINPKKLKTSSYFFSKEIDIFLLKGLGEILLKAAHLLLP